MFVFYVALLSLNGAIHTLFLFPLPDTRVSEVSSTNHQVSVIATCRNVCVHLFHDKPCRAGCEVPYSWRNSLLLFTCRRAINATCLQKCLWLRLISTHTHTHATQRLKATGCKHTRADDGGRSHTPACQDRAEDGNVGRSWRRQITPRLSEMTGQPRPSSEDGE